MNIAAFYRRLALGLLPGLCFGFATADRLSAAEARTLALGRHLSQECSSCHRIDGADNGIPSIVGQDPDLFAETIGYYRSGARTNPVMVSVAQSLDEEQVKALAAYYASLPKPQSRPAKPSGQRKTP
jgi:cytochrome c553